MENKREEVITALCDWITKTAKKETTSEGYGKLPEVVCALAELLKVDVNQWR